MAAPSTPITSHANQTPAELKANAEQRRVIVSPAVAPRTQPTLQHAAATSVANHGHEIFIQCLYMLPVVGNAMSLCCRQGDFSPSQQLDDSKRLSRSIAWIT